MRAERREETAAALGERLRAADAAIEAPDGLWERVRAQREDVTPATPVRAAGRGRLGRRPVSMTVMAVAAAAVAFVVCGTWWLISPSGFPGSVHGAAAGDPSSGASDEAGSSGRPITLRVHNAEKACRELRTLECSLRVAKDPYALYADPDNSAARVWHGDVLTSACVVTDGRLVTDEYGVSSRRWYRVEKAGGGKGSFEGWLPGVRTRNSEEVRLCGETEKPRTPGG